MDIRESLKLLGLFLFALLLCDLVKLGISRLIVEEELPYQDPEVPVRVICSQYDESHEWLGFRDRSINQYSKEMFFYPYRGVIYRCNIMVANTNFKVKSEVGDLL